MAGLACSGAGLELFGIGGGLVRPKGWRERVGHPMAQDLGFFGEVGRKGRLRLSNG